MFENSWIGRDAMLCDATPKLVFYRCYYVMRCFLTNWRGTIFAANYSYKSKERSLFFKRDKLEKFSTIFISCVTKKISPNFFAKLDWFWTDEKKSGK